MGENRRDHDLRVDVRLTELEHDLKVTNRRLDDEITAREALEEVVRRLQNTVKVRKRGELGLVMRFV